MALAILTNPDGSINTQGVIAELMAVFQGDADATARMNAYDAWFATAQSLGRIPKYGWQTVPGNGAYLEYLNQQLNPGGELLSPTGIVGAATVPLPDPSNVIMRLGWVLHPKNAHSANE
jgi:hypothetical protein